MLDRREARRVDLAKEQNRRAAALRDESERVAVSYEQGYADAMLDAIERVGVFFMKGGERNGQKTS